MPKEILVKRVRVEPGDSPVPSTCPCCGRPLTTVRGHIYRDDESCGVYYAGWSRAHPNLGVLLVFSLAFLATDPKAPARAMALECRLGGGGEFGLQVREPAASPWTEADLGAAIASRAALLADPALQAYYRLAQQIIHDDARIHVAIQHRVSA